MVRVPCERELNHWSNAPTGIWQESSFPSLSEKRHATLLIGWSEILISVSVALRRIHWRWRESHKAALRSFPGMRYDSGMRHLSNGALHRIKGILPLPQRALDPVVI